MLMRLSKRQWWICLHREGIVGLVETELINSMLIFKKSGLVFSSLCTFYTVHIYIASSRSGLVVVHYTVSSYSPYHQISLPNAHHTVASVMQTVVRLGWVGSHQVQPTSHFILSEQNFKTLSICSIVLVTASVTFVCLSLLCVYFPLRSWLQLFAM